MSQVIESIPTTAIERYLARADHGNGMIFDVVLFLEGEVNIEKLAKSWQETISENPQIFFQLSGRGTSQIWKQTQFSSALFEVQGTNDGEVNIRRGVGARLSMFTARDSPSIGNAEIEVSSVRLKFSFHHAVCDGVGAARVIYRTMQRYRDGKPLPERQTQAVAQLAPTQVAKTLPVPQFANFWATIRGHNVRLARHALNHRMPNSSGLVTQEPEPIFLELGAERSDQIRIRLRQQKISVNDFGVAAVLHALAAATQPASRRYLSILNPVQTRSWNERYSTRNHIGFAFIRRRHDQLSTIQETLESVTSQMKHVRSSGIAGELSQGIEIAERFPGAVSCIDRLGWFVPTASVTCLSGVKYGKRTGLLTEPRKLASSTSSQSVQRAQTYRAGDATVKGIQILGPLQSRGQLSITIWDTGSGINLSLRGSTKQHLGELGSVVAREIEQVVGTYLCE